jgi:hypothetical protein
VGQVKVLLEQILFLAPLLLTEVVAVEVLTIKMGLLAVLVEGERAQELPLEPAVLETLHLRRHHKGIMVALVPHQHRDIQVAVAVERALLVRQQQVPQVALVVMVLHQLLVVLL